MTRTTIGLICCQCGDPITGPVWKWKDGAPVCRPCTFSITSFRTARMKRQKIRTDRALGFHFNGWWFPLALAFTVIVYLFLR